MKINKIVITAISIISLFQQTSLAFDNPFLNFKNVTLSNDQSVLFPQLSLIQAPTGNDKIDLIPEIPAFTLYVRLGLSNGIALNSQQRTELADKLANEKIPLIMNKLNQEGLLKEVIKLSKVFKIDPLHILGPIIGENSFNGSIDRTIQDTYANLFQKHNIDSMSDKMKQLTNNAEAQRCLSSEISNYWKWRCIVFYSERTINNANSDLMSGFYSFTRNGKTGTFGLGQVQPFLLWSLNDIVTKYTNYEKFDVDNIEKPMRIIFNNKEMLAYVAANALMAIHIYKIIAAVDISRNPGLTTTLYNLGDEYKRAYNFAIKRQSTQSAIYPEVNYMGWYINKNANLIRSLLKRYTGE